MNDTSLPVFGRRRDTTESMTSVPLPRTPAVIPATPAALNDTSATASIVAAAATAAAVTTRADIAELRALCLARMDATAVASLQPERLLIEVERLISDLATERRVQLNGREQRSLATELVDDMLVDARLKDGSRVNIILPPLSLDGPALSIRKFSKKPIDFDKLISYGSLTPPIARILEIAARCRLNIIVSGGTGSGKTTMMNAMSRFIDPAERVVTVEDAAELQLQQPHVVRLETRPPSLEGKGEVNARDLVRNALRMRPDRIIIGEVRGAEAFDMLQAMNTGHDGSMSTIHANNTRDALSRIENMVQMSSMGLSPKAIRTQVVAAVNMIVQVERQRDGGRRVTQVTEIAGIEGETQLLNDIFKFEMTGETANGKIMGRYEVSRIRSTFTERLQYFGLDRAWNHALEDIQ
jgi:pilus assembly protein CpaF